MSPGWVLERLPLIQRWRPWFLDHWVIRATLVKYMLEIDLRYTTPHHVYEMRYDGFLLPERINVWRTSICVWHLLSPYCVISFDWFQMFSTVFKCGVVYNYWNLWCFFDVCTKQTTRQETCNYMYIYVYIVVYVYIFFAMHVFMFSNYCKLPLSMHSIDSPKEPFRLLTYETNGWSFPTEILPNAGPE